MLADKKAYVVAVNMGYGHQRAVFPLRHICREIISANDYKGIPKKDKLRWESTRTFYEWVSRMRNFPLIGQKIFNAMDHFQKIQAFYPKRDLSEPGFQTKQIYRMIKRGFGKHLIDDLNKNPLPYITSFFITAFFAEEHGYKGEIYCLCTDTDISRAWAPLKPKTSRIIYLAPNKRVKDRLILYGVPEEKIVLTGFPLPQEGREEDFARRIALLDPRGVYQKKHQEFLSQNTFQDRVVNLTFAVGGAAAQAEIGVQILNSLKQDIKDKKVKLNLVAGISLPVKKTYEKAIADNGLVNLIGEGVSVIYNKNKFEYFEEFNELIKETDVLWTKPSELSFYAGLGLPIIMAPALGSQEESNKSWLYMMGSGVEQNDPRYTNEWFFDYLGSGWFAQAAVNGYLNAPKNGTKHIEDLVFEQNKTEIQDIHFI